MISVNIRSVVISVIALCVSVAAFAQSPEQLVDVVATGYGTTVREATKAALRSAVEAVVGTMVDATTLVENDKLIEDEILTYSAGMIAGAKTIGEPKKSSDGIYAVKVKASVKKGTLAEKLHAASTVNVALDGADLFARMTAAKENLADAETMIKAVLAKHITCVVADAVPGEDGKSPIDLDPKTGEVLVNVRVRIDQAKYAKFANEVIEKISPMAIKNIKIKAKGIFSSEPYNLKRFDISAESEQYPFRVMTSIRTGSAVAFQLDHNILNAILTSLDTGSIGVEVSLFDVDGCEMARSHKVLCDRRNKGEKYAISIFTCRSCSKESGAIMPFYRGDNSHNFSIIDNLEYEGTYKISLGKFTPDELKSVGPLKIRIGHMKNDQFHNVL